MFQADEESEPETKKFRIDPAYSPQSLDSDDEETIREEEARGEAMTRDEELALLQKVRIIALSNANGLQPILINHLTHSLQ